MSYTRRKENDWIWLFCSCSSARNRRIFVIFLAVLLIADNYCETGKMSIIFICKDRAYTESLFNARTHMRCNPSSGSLIRLGHTLARVEEDSFYLPCSILLFFISDAVVHFEVHHDTHTHTTISPGPHSTKAWVFKLWPGGRIQPLGGFDLEPGTW